MNIAMQSVMELQDAITRQCHITQDKQVLLISGGENLDPMSRVCSYSAGTDSNPIFLFSKHSIEAANPPSASTNYGSECFFKDKMEDSFNMPPTYDTVVARTQLALHFSDTAQSEFQSCERLVHDQHLQHQGWAAVIANLDDITNAFKARSEILLQNLEDYLTTRDESLRLIAGFPNLIELLSKIPLLKTLLISYDEENRKPKTLLEWIVAQDTKNTLEQMMQQCQAGLEQFNEGLKESLLSEVQSLLSTINNVTMKEVRGLEERLYGLEQLMQGARKIVDDQTEMSQAFVNNQARARNLQDQSVLPDLCTSHKRQLALMLKNHEQLQDIRRRCSAAKGELSANLHTRLRWVMYVEKNLCDIDSKLIIRHETLKKIRRRLEIIRQIMSSPQIYCRTVVEVARRKLFSAKFIAFAGSLSEKCSSVHCKELMKRDEFDAFIQHHFLKALFPGLEDVPPPFATKNPHSFDDRLPCLTEDDVIFLKHEVPELAENLRFDDQLNECLNDVTSDSLVMSEFFQKKNTEKEKEKKLQVSSPQQQQQLDLSSQSVEIITQEESRQLELEAAYQSTAEAGLLLPIDAVISDDQSRNINATASMETSPEADDIQSGDTFMTADFYIDESMPSSMTELASSKKLAELQGILQDRTALLESREREISDGKRLIDEMTTKMRKQENLMKSLNESIHVNIVAFKSDLNNFKLEETNNGKESSKEFNQLLQNLVEFWNEKNVKMLKEIREEENAKYEIVAKELQEKLDSEKIFSQNCQSENQTFKELLEEKKTECQNLGTELNELKETLNKIAYENKIENEKLRINFESELEKKEIEKEKMISEEMMKKFEIEKCNLFENLKKDQFENERRILEELTKVLNEKHQLELEKYRTEFEELLNSERNSVKELHEECRNQKEREEEIMKLNVDAAERLKSNHETEIKSFEDKYNTTFEELEKCKSELSELKMEIKSHSEKLKELQERSDSEVIESEKNNQFKNDLNESKEMMEKNEESHVSAERKKKKIFESGDDEMPLQNLNLSEDVERECDDAFQTGICDFQSCSFNDRLSSRDDNKDIELQLRVDDYLPVQRHEEMLQKSRLEMEEEKTLAVQTAIEEERHRHDDLLSDLVKKHEQEKISLKTNYEAERQILFNEALNKALAERDGQINELEKMIYDLQHDVKKTNKLTTGQDMDSQRYVQIKLEEELAVAKQEILRLESQMRGLSSSSFMGQSCLMGQSFLPLASSEYSTVERTIHPEMMQRNKDMEKLKEKLLQLSIDSSLSSLIMQHVNINGCQEGDVVLFVFDDDLGHFLAFFTSPDSHKHFLHADSLALFETNSGFKESRKWIVAEVKSREFCLAKKEQNRFNVKVGTKFYRVKAKLWNPIDKPSLGAAAAAASTPDEEKQIGKDDDLADRKS